MRLEPKRIPPIARAAALGLGMLLAACTGIGVRPSTQPGSTSPSSAAQPSATADMAASPPAPSASDAAGATPQPSRITEAQAIAAVQAFAPHATGLHVTETETLPMGPSFRVQSEGIIAEVDEATGEVRMFLDNGAMPTSRTVKLSKDEAQAAATAWLAAHGVATSGLAPTTTLMDHGETQEYAVRFEGRVNGARIPHNVNVSVDPATGTVYAFVLFTRPFVTPPAPKLTLDQAVAAGRAEEQDPGAKMTSAVLAVTFDASGAQILVYEVDLTRTDGFYVKLQVDALSGAVTVMGRG